MCASDGVVPAVAATYDRAAPDYQRWWAPVIAPAALRLLDLVAPLVAERPGATIVDVGAGTGTLARAAVARWPRVRAIAVDPSPGMLAVGRAVAARSLSRAANRRLGWEAGPAEQLRFEAASVDVVVSSFALQYLPSRVAALREAHRVMVPGGAVAVVTWLSGAASFTPWRLFDEVLRELGVERPPSAETGLFRSLPSAAALARRAGFHDVRAAAGVVDYQWTLDTLVHCTLEFEEREVVDSLDPQSRGRLERLWRRRIASLAPADLRYRDAVAYVSGRRPG